MSAIDLSSKSGPVDQQGTLNSCVGHAVTTVFEVACGVSDRSRLAVYYNARALEGNTGRDIGCQIRNAIKGIALNGAYDEALWPYDPSKVLVAPDATAVASGVSTKGLVGSYAQVTNLASLKAALLAGRPVAFGLRVPSTFVSETKYDGFLPYPVSGTSFIGQHSMVAVGFDDATGNVKVKNSFGPTWGAQGYLFMPYQWFNPMSYVSDAWTIIPK